MPEADYTIDFQWFSVTFVIFDEIVAGRSGGQGGQQEKFGNSVIVKIGIPTSNANN